MRKRRAMLPVRGLRGRITLLSVLLAAGVSAVLLALAWKLVSDSVAAVPQMPPGTTVQVDGVEVEASALTEYLREQAQTRVLLAGGVAFTCVVLAAGILAWTLTAYVLRPLREIAGTARKLSAESLDERIGTLRPRDELARLGETIDDMLDRLANAFGAQRRFVANASHELRTPLTVMRTELDVTLADPDADTTELRRMAHVVRAQTQRAEQLVAALLVLARTEGAELAVWERVDLATVLTSAWEAVRDEAAERALHVEFDTPPALALGDPALLERVAGNLLENAVRHNSSGGWVTVRTRSRPDDVTMTVRSSGPLIDPETVTELFDPFHRGGVARTGRSGRTGSGLGLSIVRAAAQAHRGSVDAEPVVGGGLAVTVRVPTPSNGATG